MSLICACVLQAGSARCVAGDTAMQQKVDGAVANILARARDADQCRYDAGLMWTRINDQRVEVTQSGVFADKMAEGGLMQAEYVQGKCLMICLRNIRLRY